MEYSVLVGLGYWYCTGVMTGVRVTSVTVSAIELRSRHVIRVLKVSKHLSNTF